MAFSLGGAFGLGGGSSTKRTPGALAKKMGTDFGGKITSADGKTAGSTTPTGPSKIQQMAERFGFRGGSATAQPPMPALPGGIKPIPMTGGMEGLKSALPSPVASQITAMPTPVRPGLAAPATPSPAPGGGVPSVPGAAMSTINPSADLRSQAITPNNAGAPNLTALAQQKFSDFMAGQADERQAGIRAIGQGAAKFGRIGSGMTTNQLTDFGDLMNRRELEAARGLASDVAISDLGEQRSQRDELRGERGFQYGASRDALGDRVQQRLLEEQLLNSQFGRDATRTQIGFQGSPAAMQFAASQDYGQSANDALGGVGGYLQNKELMAALAEYMKRQQGGAAGAPAGGPAPVVGPGGY